MHWETATGNLAALRSECGVLTYLTLQPGGDRLMARVPQNGLWTSVDGGATWTQMVAEDDIEMLGLLTSMVFDPSSSSRFWATGVYQGGVVRTDDAGTTFQRLGDVDLVDFVSIDLTDPARTTLLAGRHESRTLYRSTDAGATWMDVSTGLPEGSGTSAAPLALDDQTFLLGTYAGDASGVFRTTDGGATWTRVWDGAVGSRPLVLGEAIYFLLDGGEGVISSVDNGETWDQHDGGGPTGGRGLTAAGSSRSLIGLPDGRLATIGAHNLLVSDDQGDSWSAIGPTLPFIPNDVVYSSQAERFYVWTDECDQPETTEPTATADSVRALAEDSIMQLPFSVGPQSADTAAPMTTSASTSTGPSTGSSTTSPASSGPTTTEAPRTQSS